MNIIYIHSHDTGRYVQPYGHSIPTPNIQKLAEEGVLFRQAFCANPTCSPSRACLLSGQWAHTAGMGGLVNRGWSLPTPKNLIMHTLAEVGYETVLAGFQHVVKDVNEAGYSRNLARETTFSGETEERAAAFIAEASKSDNQPFFLDVGFFETHRARSVKPGGFAPQPNGEAKTDSRYVKPPAPFPDTPETRQDMADYIDAARTLDQKMGVVFSALEENKLADKTLVICTTDHGLAFPEMKSRLTDHGIGVMLIMRGPAGFSGGLVIDELVSQIDLFPTICDMLSIDHPKWLQGYSILPMLQGTADKIRSEIFAEVNYHCCYEPQRAIRTKRWKYIRRYDQAPKWAMPNCDDSISKTLFLDHGWQGHQPESERLYDLVFDPFERHNLISSGQADEQILQSMRQRLEGWRIETKDPTLEHPIMPSPETAVLNKYDAISPNDEEYPASQFLQEMTDRAT